MSAAADVGVMSRLRGGHLHHFYSITAGGKSFDFHPLGTLLSQIIVSEERKESETTAQVILKVIYG